ncbi:MAG: peptide/nickel transport system permease protein [Thermomicrobiales bacterium]|nr:peptide/nickel transport system permease protein [Thermomicrobiales bacterium]
MAQRDESLPAIGYRLSARALEQTARRQTSLWGDAARRLRHDKAAVAGLAIIVVLILVAIFAPAIAPHSPTDQSFINKLKAPSRDYPLGTDEFGRDTLSRVVYGSRVALRVGLLPVVFALILGVAAGLAAGYYGGATDQIIMRLTDILLAFPWLLLAIGIVAILGPGINNVIIAVGIIYVPAFARIVRGSVLSIKEKEYVEAARAIGQPDLQIMTRHILSNAWAPIIVQATLSVGQAIIYAAGLSFIGLGTQPPAADWGVMLKSGHEFLRDSPWMGVFPGLAILVTVLAFNLFGDGLRDALDPRIR